MKKLMIAAAAAAMIGSVWTAAGDALVYQATYNLKTTVGKASKAGKTTVNLGKDNTDTFWYQDAAVSAFFTTNDTGIVILDTTNFVLKAVGGTKVPTLTKAGQANTALTDLLATLAGTYNKKSLNKWCLTFKAEVPGVCYRVAGSIKATGYFSDDECLSGLNPAIADAFGAPTLEKSTKAELFAADVSGNAMSLSKKADLVDAADVLDNTKGERIITLLAIAGHGTYGKVYDDTTGKKDLPGFTGFSGNAVGTADMPECLSCCATDVPVEAWDCCGVAATDTAVFGTFSFKYNDKGTKALY